MPFVLIILFQLVSGSICDRNLTEVVRSIEFNMQGMHHVQERAMINESVYQLFKSLHGWNVSSSLHNPMNSYIGFDNNDFYMIKDCRHELTYCNRVESWEAFGSPNFLAYVRNSFIFGTPERFIFVLDDSGVMGQFLEVTGEYPTTERTWYSQDDGWGESYKFASTQITTGASSCEVDVYGQTFTRRAEQGVIGLDSDAVCWQPGITRVVWKGWEYCGKNGTLCGDGDGDCQTDDDCIGDLICFQRTNQDLREGYDFSLLADVVGGAGADICVHQHIANEAIPLDLMILIIFSGISFAVSMIYCAHKSGIFHLVEEYILKESIMAILGISWDVMEILSLYIGYFGSVQHNEKASQLIKIMFIITITFSSIGFCVCIYIRFRTFLWEVVFPTEKLITPSTQHQLSSMNLFSKKGHLDLSPTSSHNIQEDVIDCLQQTHEQFIVIYHNTTADIVCLLLVELPQSLLSVYYLCLYLEDIDRVYIVCVVIQLVSLGIFTSAISARTHAKKLISVTKRMFEEQERAKSEIHMMKLAPFRRMMTFADEDDEVSLSSTADSLGSRKCSTTSAMTNFAFTSLTNIFKKLNSPALTTAGSTKEGKTDSVTKPPCPSPSPLSADAANLFDDSMDNDSTATVPVEISEIMNDDTIISTRLSKESSHGMVKTKSTESTMSYGSSQHSFARNLSKIIQVVQTKEGKALCSKSKVPMCASRSDSILSRDVMFKDSHTAGMPKWPPPPTLTHSPSLDNSQGSFKNFRCKPTRETGSRPGTPGSISVRLPGGDCSSSNANSRRSSFDVNATAFPSDSPARAPANVQRGIFYE